MSTMLMQRLFHSSDVICLKFLGDYLLAGIAGTLKIFSVELKTCLKDIEIFNGHRIHGIEVLDNGNVLIFGGKEVAVVSLIFSEKEVNWNIAAFLELNDWILHTHWLPRSGNIAIITAHNVVWLWPWSNGSLSVRSVKCTEKCILYSALICGTENEDSIVFAGTVFREIILWTPGEEFECDQPVLHRLNGHNGVIFSVSWDWNTSVICSTSDDRTVRTWKVTFSSSKNWRTSSVVPLQVFYGHTARVWQSLILENAVASCGEDSQICVWSFCGALLHKWDRSSSGCVWTLDYSQKHKLLVAGSGDGSIIFLPLSVPVLTKSATLLPQKFVSPSFDCIRKLCLLKSGSVIVITENGTLYTLSPDKQCLWKTVDKENRFSNYCILSVSCDRSYFGLASLNGDIRLYEASNMMCYLDHKVEEGKVWAFIWLSNDEFLICGDEGRLSVWEIDRKSGILDLNCISRFVLPRARERWPTAAVTMRVESNKYMICGDRHGSLHLYKFLDTACSVYKTPCHSLFKIHRNLGVTSLLEFENELLSTGRDGMLRYYRVEDSHLCVLSSRRMALDWVAKALVCPVQGSVLVVGFKEKNMTVWCAKERSIILDIDCGGGHRSWDCLLSKEDEMHIAFIRDKHIFYGQWLFSTLVQPALLHGTLANEINCLVHLSSCPTIIAFGGEDGTVLVAEFSSNLSALNYSIALTTHISSIKCITRHGNCFISAGGRAQIKAWRHTPGKVRESSCCEVASFMLKGDDRKSQCRPGIPTMDPEMRIMDTCCASMDSKLLLIALGCSDGALRFLLFDTLDFSFTLIGESMFHKRCILKVLNIDLSSERTVILTAASDGILALWNASLSPELVENPFWSKRFHSSGINSVHALVLENCGKQCVLIASGGDDNALVMCALEIDESSSVSVLAEWRSCSVHAAQITGVSILNHWLISSSVDQRLTVWKWSLSTSESTSLNCSFVCQQMCHISDIQDMHVWEESHGFVVCVAGKGVEIIKLQLKEIFEAQDF